MKNGVFSMHTSFKTDLRVQLIYMNKAELITRIAEDVGVTKKQAEDMIESFVNIVTDTLKKGGEVTIAGFGAFMSKQRKGRTGVNPQNPSEKIQIPSVTVPKFKAGKGLKDALKAKKEMPPEPPSGEAPIL
jgi:DNA-binding protein HU-beta